MKSKNNSIVKYSSLFSEYKSCAAKERNLKISQSKPLISQYSLTRFTSSQSKIKTKTPLNVINNLFNKKKTQTDNNNIDIKISVNYPKKTKSSVGNIKSNNYKRNHNRSISDNFYQNNLNISLTNYTQNIPQPYNEQMINIQDIYQNTELQDSKMVIEDNNTSPYTPGNNPNINNKLFFTSDNCNEFALNNSNSHKDKIPSDKIKITYDFIRSCLIEGLASLNHEVKERDQDKIDFLNKKFELYKNALIQLGRLESNEEGIELLKVIIEGINGLLVYYNDNKEKMNVNYTDLFHKYVEIQKDDHDKAIRIKELEKKIENLQNKLPSKHQKHQSTHQIDSRNNFKANPRLCMNFPDCDPEKKKDKECNNKNRTHTEERSTNNSQEVTINDLESLYFSKKIPEKNLISTQVPKLNLNFNTWNKKPEYSLKNLTSQLNNSKLEYNTNYSLDNKKVIPSTIQGNFKTNCFINQCKSFLKMTSLADLRRSNFK